MCNILRKVCPQRGITSVGSGQASRDGQKDTAMTDGRFAIAVDFDGTIVDNQFPKIGALSPGAVRWLGQWSANPKVQLLLWTCRDGVYLDEAVSFCEEHRICFSGVNKNPDQTWSLSPKAYANVYIDDLSFGAPTHLLDGFRCPVINWFHVGPVVQDMINRFTKGELISPAHQSSPARRKKQGWGEQIEVHEPIVKAYLKSIEHVFPEDVNRIY